MTLPAAIPQEQPTPTHSFFYLRKPVFHLLFGHGYVTFEDDEATTKAFTVIRVVFQRGKPLEGCPDVLADRGVHHLSGPLLNAPVYPGRLIGHNSPEGFWTDEAVAERVLAERLEMVA